MSRGYSVEQWAAWIDEQRASGVSIAAFCESIGVSQNAFYVRRRQLAEQPHRSEAEQPHPSNTAGFVSLRLAGSDPVAQDRALVEIELPGRIVVRVNNRQIVGDIVSVILEHGEQR